MTTSPAHQSYLDAKVEFEAFEQKVRACQDAHLLPGFNAHLQDLAIAVEERFEAWNSEVDKILNTPVELPEYFKPVPQPTYSGIWHQDYADSTPGAA